MWVGKEELEKCSCDHVAHPASWYQNCGGFALGIEGWYMPTENTEEYLSDFRKAERKNMWRPLEEKFAKKILKDFPELRIVSKKAIDNVDVDTNRYEIIAFRIERNWWTATFHFMKCDRNGDWLEKQGHYPTILRHRYEEIYDIWGKHDGHIYFFVRERNKTKKGMHYTTCTIKRS